MYNEDFVTVYASGGQHLIKTPNGEMIPCLVWTRVVDINQEMPYVIAKIQCNIANNDEAFDLPMPKDKTRIYELEK